MTRQKEQQAVALHLAGKKFDEIAELVGYTNRGTAYETVMRALPRETVADIEEIRNVEIARIDAMLESIWPVAIEDPEWARQFADAKKVVPLKDDEGREVVFIISVRCQARSNRQGHQTHGAPGAIPGS